MNYWIFQSIVERQDLRDTLQEQKEDTRLASRYRQQMSPGDLVYFWLAGDERMRGIYGWGELRSAPYLTDDGQEFRVKVRYFKRLHSPLPAVKIRTTPPLEELMIFRAPQATNFLLTKEEAKMIASLLNPDERPDI